MCDVKVRYYDKTSRKHAIGMITFYGKLEELIDSPRVVLKVSGKKLIFNPVKTGGIKLANSKIQLWDDADIAKDFEGEYSLKYDSSNEVYYLDKEEKDDIQVLGSSRYGVAHRVFEGKYVEDIPDNIPCKTFVKEEKPVKNATEKVVISTLIDKLIQFIEEDKKEDAKAMALAVKSLANDC